MTMTHLYDDFGSAEYSLGDAAAALTEDGLEDVRLSAFEKGYQAGWEDATKAHEADHEKLSTDLAQTLQDMSFTYHEAFSKLSLAMQPLMTKIVTKILPEIARKTLGTHVMTEVANLMKIEGDGAVELAFAPENLTLIEDLVSGAAPLPFKLTADANFSGGQVFVRVASSEREVNLDAVQASIAIAVDAFFDQTQKEMNHG
jgi:flagellar assembly protein FliH